MIKKENWFYIVKKDDDLQKVAKKNKIFPMKLLVLNNLTPEMIHEGKILILR